MKKERQRFLLGTANMLVSGFALSLVILFSSLSLDFFSMLTLTFLRFLIPTLLLFVVFLWREKTKTFSYFSIGKEDGAKILRAFLVVVAQLAILYFLTIGTLLDATVLLNTGPLFIPILEWLFLRLKIGKSTIVAMIVSAIGVYLILKPEWTLFRTASLIGLLAGICQAGSQILFGIYAKEERGLVSLFRLFFFSTCLSLVPLLFFDFYWKPLFNLPNRAWIYLSLLGIVALFSQYFRSRAYFYGKPSTLACFFYISIVFSMVFDWLFFHRKPDILSYVGASLVIIGGILKIYLRHLILKRKGR